MRYLALTYIACTLLATSCYNKQAGAIVKIDPQEMKTWVQYKSDKITIAYPDSLSIDTAFLDLEFKIELPKIKNTFPTNLTFSTTEQAPPKGVDVNVYLRNYITTVLPTAKIISSDKRSLGGQESYYYQINYQHNKHDLNIDFYAIIVDSKIYEISFFNKKGNIERTQSLKDKILSTIKFHNL